MTNDPSPDNSISRSARDPGEVERRAWSINLARDGLDFAAIELTDSQPTGAQILDAGGISDTAQWSLVAILPTGDFEDIRPAEPFDISGRGVERFIAFHTDRLFRLTIRDRFVLWGRSTIGGSEIIALADPGPHEAVFVDVPGGTDRMIAETDDIDLTDPKVERLIVATKPDPDKFEVIVIYNGIVKPLVVHRDDTVAAVISAARPLFGSPGGDLVLVAEDGRELPPQHTLRQERIKRGERLSLRPPVVRGGAA